MKIPPARALAEEELYLLNAVIQNAKIVQNKGENRLVVPASPMLIDIVKALRLVDAPGEEARELPTSLTTVPSQQRIGEQTLLAAAILKFLAMGQLWGHGTRDHYTRATKLLVDVLGASKPMQEITPTDIAKVKGISMALPQQHYAHNSQASLEEAIATATRSGARTRALSTVGNELYAISVFFRWCVSQWIIDRSPAERITIPRHLMSGDHAREAFLIEDLNRIFRAPIYTGCRNDRWFFATPGELRPREARFWLPLIALFSGLRLGEIAQLTTSNVVEIERILCFKIMPTPSPNGEEMLLKTNAARRKIPVHTQLLRLGFREFIAGKKGRLFPELTSPSIRKSTTYYSRWFANRFLSSIGITGRRISFHSFRHNFRDAMREGNVQSDFVRILGGWAPRHSADRYGGGRAPVLAREIEKVEYPGLDISHLYVA